MLVGPCENLANDVLHNFSGRAHLHIRSLISASVYSNPFSRHKSSTYSVRSLSGVAPFGNAGRLFLTE